MKKINKFILEVGVKVVVAMNIIYFGTRGMIGLMNLVGASKSLGVNNLGYILMFLLPSIPVAVAYVTIKSFRVVPKSKLESVTAEVVSTTKANFISI